MPDCRSIGVNMSSIRRCVFSGIVSRSIPVCAGGFMRRGFDRSLVELVRWCSIPVHGAGRALQNHRRGSPDFV